MRRGLLTAFVLLVVMLGHLFTTRPVSAFAWGNFAGDDKLSAEARQNASEYLAALVQIYGALSRLEIDPKLNMREQFQSAQKRFSGIQERLSEFSARVAKSGPSDNQRLDLKRLNAMEAADFARSHEALNVELSSDSTVTVADLFGGNDRRRMPTTVSAGLAAMSQGTRSCSKLMFRLLAAKTPMTNSDVVEFLSALHWLTQMGLLFSKVAPE